MHPATIGLGVARHVFRVHGVGAAKQVTVCKKLRRGEFLVFFEVLPPCPVGIEACGTVNLWARDLRASVPRL